MSAAQDDIAIRLRNVEVLREMPHRQLAALAVRGRTISAAKGTVIFVTGAPPGLYAVLRGRVIVLTRPDPATEMEIFTHRPDEIFGEASLLLNRHVNEARAAEEALVVEFDAEVVHCALRESHSATLALAKLLAGRMALAEARLGDVALHRVKERVRRLLEHLVADGGIADSRGYMIRDRLTHEELARMVGAGRVAVTRALADLRRAGRVTVRGRRIIVRRNGSADE